MKKNSGVHLSNKRLGETPLEAILRFKKENPEYENESMTYAGRLDPMAEGLLLILLGDELAKKDEYLNLPKTYEFEVLWGFQTDTLDLLGLVGESQKSQVEKEQIKKYLSNSIGKSEQQYPAYSSKPVGGKPLFQWAREGKLDEIEIPNHEVEIYGAEFLSRRTISGRALFDVIKQRISLVKGDFRQTEILNKWKEVLDGRDDESFTIDAMSVVVSSGFYVRQFVSDMAQSLRSDALTFGIKRIKVGDFIQVDN